MPDPSEIGDMVVAQLKQWAHNVHRNTTHMFDDMNLTNYIRLVIVVGAYFLLRPYLIKLGAKLQAKEHEKEIDPYDLATVKAAISPNSLRGQVEVPVDTDSEGEEPTTGETKGADWGKKARKRQRQMLRKVLEADEKLRLEKEGAEDDKDIMEYLDDYKEGWD